MPNNIPNSTDYEHPNEPNLVDLHKALQYNSDGEPCLRVLTFTETPNYTDADVDAHLTGGTGVSYSSGSISIGQAVGTTDNVEFNDVAVNGSLNVSGGIDADTLDSQPPAFYLDYENFTNTPPDPAALSFVSTLIFS